MRINLKHRLLLLAICVFIAAIVAHHINDQFRLQAFSIANRIVNNNPNNQIVTLAEEFGADSYGNNLQSQALAFNIGTTIQSKYLISNGENINPSKEYQLAYRFNFNFDIDSIVETHFDTNSTSTI